jgi:hypothetical protein
MVLEAKFGQHLPLNWQSESYARKGVELSVSTLADWVGTADAVLSPLHALIEAHVLGAERLHGDDATVPLLARGKTVAARLWTYVRDDRPFAGPAPPAAVFYFSRDRTAEYPRRHLASYAGILRADAYAWYDELNRAGRKPGPVTEAACWAHFRGKVFELAEVARAPLAAEAVQRIDRVFEAERAVNGCPAAERLARTGGTSWLRSWPTSMPGCCRPVAGYPPQRPDQGARLCPQALARVNPVPQRRPDLPHYNAPSAASLSAERPGCARAAITAANGLR